MSATGSVVFLTTSQLAERWGVSPGRLVNDRAAGRGPAYVKIGHSCRYKLADVEAFEASARVQPDGQDDQASEVQP